jgi:hypothetical protein
MSPTAEQMRSTSRDEFGWTFPSIFDPDRSLAGQLGASYQPFYAVLDAEGHLVARSLTRGGAGWEFLLDALDAPAS